MGNVQRGQAVQRQLRVILLGEAAFVARKQAVRDALRGFQRGFCTAQVGFGLFAAACIQRVGAGGFDFGQRLSGAHVVAGLQGDAAQGAGDGCVDVVAVFQAGAAFFVVGLFGGVGGVTCGLTGANTLGEPYRSKVFTFSG